MSSTSGGERILYVKAGRWRCTRSDKVILAGRNLAQWRCGPALCQLAAVQQWSFAAEGVQIAWSEDNFGAAGLQIFGVPAVEERYLLDRRARDGPEMS